MTFAERFKTARKAGRMTQPEAQRILGLKSAQTVSNWECGRSHPWPSQQEEILAKITAKAVRIESMAEPAQRERRRISDLL